MTILIKFLTTLAWMAALISTGASILIIFGWAYENFSKDGQLGVRIRGRRTTWKRWPFVTAVISWAWIFAVGF